VSRRPISAWSGLSIRPQRAPTGAASGGRLAASIAKGIKTAFWPWRKQRAGRCAAVGPRALPRCGTPPSAGCREEIGSAASPSAALCSPQDRRLHAGHKDDGQPAPHWPGRAQKGPRAGGSRHRASPGRRNGAPPRGSSTLGSARQPDASLPDPAETARSGWAYGLARPLDRAATHHGAATANSHPGTPYLGPGPGSGQPGLPVPWSPQRQRNLRLPRLAWNWAASARTRRPGFSGTPPLCRLQLRRPVGAPKTRSASANRPHAWPSIERPCG